MPNFTLVKSFCFLIAFLFSVNVFAGEIKGKVVNEETGETLVGAIVQIKGTNFSAATDASGNFRIENIKDGSYQVSISFIGFETITKKVVILNNETVVVIFKLDEAALSIEEITINGQLNKETEASSRYSEKVADNVTNVISSKTIEKSPDINAANVLQRLPGITIDRSTSGNNSTAIIRGMEPRYNNTLVNGIKIASPDEKSRFVPLDIVPSDLLKRIEVSKSLTPDMEADAIGGTVNLIMRDAPDSFTLKANGSLGYSQIFFDRKFKTFDQSVIQQKNLYDLNGAAYVAQPNDFTRGNLIITDKQAPPNYTAGLTLGSRFLNNKLGVLISASAQNEYSGVESQSYSIANTFNTSERQSVSTRNINTQQQNQGLIAHVDYRFNAKNKIALNNVFLITDIAEARVSVDTDLVGNGRTLPGTGFINPRYRTLTTHQKVENLKVEGQHVLGSNLIYDWALNYSDASKDAPDRVDILTDFLIRADLKPTSTYFDNINRFWQKNDDKDYSAYSNISSVNRIAGYKTLIKAGIMYRYKTRFNNADGYNLRPLQDSNGVKQVYTGPENARWLVYNPRGTPEFDVNNYVAHEKVGGAFVEARVNINQLQILTGLRVENTNQDYTINALIGSAPNHVDKSYTDFLPCLNLKYELTPNQNLRLSYFRSIARPGYYELVPYTIKGTDFDERGNPYLNHTESDNIDLRYEIYANREDQLLIGGFYKNLTNPIEFNLLSSGNGTYLYQPTNSKNAAGESKAVNRGLELVVAKYFGKFGITGNYTYTQSTTTSAKSYNDLVNKTFPTIYVDRPLVGQSEHIANLSLIYRIPNQGFYIQLASVYIGKTLKNFTSTLYGDFYQNPQISLALSVEKRLNNKFVLFGKFNNLLNTANVETTLDGVEAIRNQYKANYSIGLSYSR